MYGIVALVTVEVLVLVLSGVCVTVAFHEICGSVIFLQIICFKFCVSLAKLSFELQTICARFVGVRIVVAFCLVPRIV